MNKIFDRLFYKYISLVRLLFLRHEKFETKKKKKRIRYSLFEFLKHGYNYNFTVDKGERERREKATIDLFSNF